MHRIAYHGTLALTISLALTTPAHAYLDPGTGSIILQAAMGAVAGALVFGRSHLQRFKDWLGLSGRVSDKAERNVQE